jgi:hypothetical protein
MGNVVMHAHFLELLKRGNKDKNVIFYLHKIFESTQPKKGKMMYFANIEKLFL